MLAFILGLLLVSSAQSSPRAEDAVCDLVMPPTAVEAAAGTGYTPGGLGEDGSTWRCSWRRSSPSAFINLGLRPVTGSGEREMNEYVSSLRERQLSAEPVAGIGSAAMIVTYGVVHMIAARKPGLVVTLATAGSTTEQAMALARQAIAIQ